MEEIRAFCVGFYRNTIHALNALQSLDWCDTFYCNQKEGDPGGMPGTVENLLKLNIDYEKYNVCLTYNDTWFDALQVLLEQCRKKHIMIYANQHGYDKSVLKISEYIPNTYAKYWNAMGQYWLDRFKICTGKNPLSRRWISIGSLKDDYLHKDFRWDKNKTNGKVLVLHEPDTDLCESDTIPLKPSTTTERVVEVLKELKIDFDFKLHPSWSNFVGNYQGEDNCQGRELWRPKDCNMLEIDLPEMRNYCLVIGCYSTTLLNAVSMNIPVINISFNYPTEMGSRWGPGEMRLFPQHDVTQLKEVIFKYLGKEMKYNFEKIKYFLGPLGQVSENYYNFIKKDLDNPRKYLGAYDLSWQKEWINFSVRRSLIVKVIKGALKLLIAPYKIKKLFDKNYRKALWKQLKLRY